MTRHPGAHVEFSRAALERDALADRFHRLIRGEPGDPGDGGLAVEALALIRQNGLVERDDFHDVVDDEAGRGVAQGDGGLARRNPSKRSDRSTTP